ncbi:MAG: biotin/lipoyl-binding protein, partial [Chloroflexota bacterium]|nr:biotin/lipoyl-binding protein [Chloroflexota bacterium]
SDVSELELRRPEEGTYLVLRKAKFSDSNGHLEAPALDSQVHGAPPDTRLIDSATVAMETKHAISSHLVGIFHAWAKPRGGTLVAIGHRVKVGQLVATIESLNVINDVEAPFAGRVVEILVQEGQPVEYGQKLMVIDSSTEGESA